MISGIIAILSGFIAPALPKILGNSSDAITKLFQEPINWLAYLREEKIKTNDNNRKIELLKNGCNITEIDQKNIKKSENEEEYLREIKDLRLQNELLSEKLQNQEHIGKFNKPSKWYLGLLTSNGYTFLRGYIAIYISGYILLNTLLLFAERNDSATRQVLLIVLQENSISGLFLLGLILNYIYSLIPHVSVDSLKKKIK